MSKVDELFKIVDEIDYSTLFERVDRIWFRHNNEIHWNGDDDEEDLLNGDGDTASVTMPEGSVEFDGFLVVNVDASVGTLITLFFDLSKEIKRD